MSEEAKSKIVPNTFQTPNVLVDDYMRYLTGNETKCYLVIVRKTLGWLKRRDRIALSQIVEATGLSDGPARDAMKELCRFGLVNRTAENDPKKNFGPEYELELDDMKISMAGLVQRNAEKEDNAKKQTGRAREVAAAKRPVDPLLLTEPPFVEQTPPPVVEQTTQKPLSKALNNNKENQKFSEEETSTNLQALVSLYQKNIGVIVPLLSEKLIEASTLYPAHLYEPAFAAAVAKNARNWAFVEACIKNANDGKEYVPKRTPYTPRQPKQTATPIPAALTEDTSKFVPPPAHLRAKAHATA